MAELRDFDSYTADEQRLVDFIHKCDMEGLGYAMTDYFGTRPQEIQHDAELAQAWADGDIRHVEQIIEQRREALGCSEA